MTHQELPSYDQAPAGAIRFNTDSRKLEVYTGGPVGYGTLPNGQWMQVDSFTPDIATGGARGVWAGGWQSPATPNTSNVMDYITISTTGNAIDFGDLTTGKYGLGGCGSTTRGLWGGGRTDPSPSTSFNIIDFITIASTGNTQDFGDLNIVSSYRAGCSSSTRGLFSGGYTPTIVSDIEYVTIAQQGNAVDFGDLVTAVRFPGACSSATRGIIAGGETPTIINTINFVTISTLGNAADFGDLITARRTFNGCSNSVRGIFAGGRTPTFVNVIDYITMAALGNAVDFGDLNNAVNSSGSFSSPTRGVWAGGDTPTKINTIDYVTIMSTGNAIDFGDLTQIREAPGGLSNGHGGL